MTSATRARRRQHARAIRQALALCEAGLHARPRITPATAQPQPRHAEAERPRDLTHLVGWVAAKREGNRNAGLFWAACCAAEAGDTGALDAIARGAREAGLGERALSSATERQADMAALWENRWPVWEPDERSGNPAERGGCTQEAAYDAGLTDEPGRWTQEIPDAKDPRLDPDSDRYDRQHAAERNFEEPDPGSIRRMQAYEGWTRRQPCAGKEPPGRELEAG